VQKSKIWNEYIKYFAKFCETYATETKNRQKVEFTEPLDKDLMPYNIKQLLTEVHEYVVTIEKERRTRGSSIFTSYNVRYIENNAESCRPYEIFYHDITPFYFIFYELFKNAYSSLYDNFGQYEESPLKQRKIYVRIGLLPKHMNEKPFDRICIVFENECPYTEKNEQIFQELRAGISPHRARGTGLGLFWSARFVKNYYWGELIPHLKRSNSTKNNEETVATFELIVPVNIKEAIKWTNETIRRSVAH
jgi:hypothetical protein